MLEGHRVAVVTGGSSGIGRATALNLSTNGYRVFASVRNRESGAKLEHMAKRAGRTVELVLMDVADDASVESAFAAVLEQAGHIDVLVNNAGIGANGVVEESAVAIFESVMNVNLYGPIRCIQAVLPSMRASRSGCIVNVSSVAGRVAAFAQAPYVASKWALEGLSEELAFEIAPFGVRVAIIEPGITRSSIFSKNTRVPSGTGAYGTHYSRMFRHYAEGLKHATDPDDVAEVIYHAIVTEVPTLRYVTSWSGPEMISGRRKLSDEAWVALGASEDDLAFYTSFEASFGVAIPWSDTEP